mmetsp:Transcript_105782/g.336890  ORF Transcript_105782/g.336890 Transcript_105782/m.336890 type:complete len:342 (-) Transcript_105782:27-1052(-)
MCTRIWCVLPVRIRNCTRVNHRSLPQNAVTPRAGTRNCRRTLYLVTAGWPSWEQMTLPNSRRLKSCHFFIGTSTAPTTGWPSPPSRPVTSAMYSFCTRCAELCPTKYLKASQDFPKIWTPLVWLSRRWQTPRWRGSSRLGISNRWWATCMKLVGEASHRPLGLVTTNMPAGFKTATKLSDSANCSTSHHCSTAGARAVRSSSCVSGTSKQRDSASPRHQKGCSSSSASSHQARSSGSGCLPPPPSPAAVAGTPLTFCCNRLTSSSCSEGWLWPTLNNSSSLRFRTRTCSCNLEEICLNTYASRERPQRSLKKQSLVRALASEDRLADADQAERCPPPCPPW